MIVKMLRNPSKSLDCSLLEGQEGEVSSSLGAKLVALKIAVDITPPEQPKVIEAVPEEPALNGVPETSTPVSKKRS
jgi:hypothetical protein